MSMSKGTTSRCVVVNVPTNGDFHIIANTPLIDNQKGVRNMVLHGCDKMGEQILCYLKRLQMSFLKKSRP